MISLFFFGKWRANPEVAYILFCQFPQEGPTSPPLFVSFETLSIKYASLPAYWFALEHLCISCHPILVYNLGLRVVWLTFWFVLEKGHAFAWCNRLGIIESNDNELVDKINFHGFWNFHCNDIENCMVKDTSSEEVYFYGRHVYDWSWDYVHAQRCLFLCLRNCKVDMISSQYTCHIIRSYWYHYLRYFAKVGLYLLSFNEKT